MIIAKFDGYPTSVPQSNIYEITTGQPLTLAEALAKSRIVPLPKLELIEGMPE